MKAKKKEVKREKPNQTNKERKKQTNKVSCK